MTTEELQQLPGYRKFRELLNEIFQFDLADLDFGLYRVLRRRQEAIEQYFMSTLPQRLAEYLKELEVQNRTNLETQLAELRQEIRRQQRSLGFTLIDHEGRLTALGEQQAQQGAELLRRYAQLQQELENYALAEEQVNDVLLLLKDFFERYYQEGDFIPAPRFGAGGSYALESYVDPQNAPEPNDFPGEVFHGEEIYFHWPTRGMHYVKSDTYLRNYSFEVRAGAPTNEVFFVRFVLDDVEVVADNNKAKRILFPKPEGVRFEGKTLTIPFDYRRTGDGDRRSQERVFDETLKALLDSVPDPTLRAALERNDLLRRRLRHFAALGTKDFFVHRHLDSFLMRELDYFIKSQALRWAEVADERTLARRVAVLRAFRGVASDLIRFLAQLESLQARLFEKKRLVYRADYIVAIRFVPRDLWPDILSNDAQVRYWREEMGLTEHIDEATLETHPTLPVYTGYFSESFKGRLLQDLPKQFARKRDESGALHIPSLDEITDGVLVHGENYGALRTIERYYRGAVDVVYIDPPYNSKATEILYKNGYKHSTWLTMMEERLTISKALESDAGSHVVAVDENEQERLGLLLRMVFPDHHLFCVSVVHNKKGQQGDYFSPCHDYAYFCISPRRKGTNWKKIPEEQWEWENLRAWGKESERHTAKNCFYPIYVRDGEIVGFGEVCPDDFHPGAANVERPDGIIEVYPVDSKGVERKWRYARDSIEGIRHLLRVYVTRQGEIQIQKAKDLQQPKTVWDDPKYIAGDYGTRMLTEMGIVPEEELYPKSLYTVMDSIFAVADKDAVVLDYFAGSGTTGHAVISLNREDGGHRKFILVEMGEYFDAVLLRRIQKVMYAPEWRGGRPVEQPKVEGILDESLLPIWMQRSPRLIKVLRLESYEDCLYNLNVEPLQREQALRKLSENRAWVRRYDDVFPEGNAYLLEYFADVLEDGNPAFLRPVVETDDSREVVSEWLDPDRILVKRPQTGAPNGFVEERVDWLETAALWLGLRGVSYEEVERNGRTYRILRAMRDGEQVAVVVRNAVGLEPELDREFLEKHLAGYHVIVNAPPVAACEALEDVLAAVMLEGPK